MSDGAIYAAISKRDNPFDFFLDRDCVIFDGKCDCPRPVLENCKYARKDEPSK